MHVLDFGDYRDFVTVRTRECIERNKLTEGQVMTLSTAELMALPGVGARTLRDIMEYREWRKARPTDQTTAMITCKLTQCSMCLGTYWWPVIQVERGGWYRCPCCGGL